MSNDKSKEDNSNHYELRVYLIGDYAVGKKAIINRFRILNSTKTTKDNFFAEPPKPKPQRKASNESSDDDNKKIFIPKEPTPEELEEERLRKIRENYMAYTKIYSLGSNKVSFNFFPIQEPQQLAYNYELHEEDPDYEFEKTHKMTIRNMKRDLEKYILKPPKFPGGIMGHIFMFVFDLSDTSTLDKIQTIFPELNKHFQISDNYQMILVGNKLDQKINIPQDKKDQLESFTSQANARYYEISTLMFFNFEGFVENILRDIVVPTFPELESDNFVDRYHLFMTLRPNFSKAKRVSFLSNDNPGPGSYKSNVYDYPENKDEHKKIFDNNQGRFSNYIFINKQGPKFPVISKERELINKNKEKFREKNAKKMQLQGTQSSNIWENKTRKEVQDALEINIPGYSIGTKTGNLNLKQLRLSKKQELNNLLYSAIKEDDDLTLHIKNPFMLKDNSQYEKYAIARKENFQRRVEDMKRNENDIKLKHKQNLESLEHIRQKKVKNIQLKEEIYDLKYKDRERTKSEQQQRASSQTNRALIPLSTTPGPNAYNIPGCIDTKRGFTFGCKYYIKPKPNEPQPQFGRVITEFDEIVQRASKDPFKGVKSFPERFKTPAVTEPGDTSHITEKFDRWEQNRLNSIRNANLNKFFSSREEKYDSVQLNKEKLLIEKEENLQAQIQRQLDKGDPDGNFLLRQINYAPVEEAAPKYTMKGRYEHGGIFNIKSNVGNNNALNSNANANANTSQENKLPQPNFHLGKPSLPAFSFGKAERFVMDTDANGDDGKEHKEIFENGEFMPPEMKSHQTKEVFMGTGEKCNMIKDNGVPGPGYYWIKGFAEEVVEKGDKVNEVRTKIKKKKEEEERLKRGDTGDDGNKRKRRKKQKGNGENGEDDEEEFYGDFEDVPDDDDDVEDINGVKVEEVH